MFSVLVLRADNEGEVGVEAGEVAGGAVPDLDGGVVEGAAHRVHRGISVVCNIG